MRANRLSAYDRLRRRVDRRVVRQLEFLSRVATAEPRFYRFVRAFLFPAATKVPIDRAGLVATVTGLDHELPHVIADEAS